MAIEILHRDDLPPGGFAGLKEHRLVMSPMVFGRDINPGTWPGIGEFVYLADARFDPKGETRMHRHEEIDVISIMIEGRIHHQGSLEHGQGLEVGDVQVQRAGGEGFSHNEINPDQTTNRMLQLWVLPEVEGEPASYQLFKAVAGGVTRIYGGKDDQAETLPSHTVIEIASLASGQEFVLEKRFMAYLAAGTGGANDIDVQDGDLMRGDNLHFKAASDSMLIIIY